MKKVLILVVFAILFCKVFADDFYDINTINTIELTFDDANWENILQGYYNQGNEQRLLGSALINGAVYDSVGVRFKGNSSCSSSHDKNPFNIKLDYIIDDQKIGDYGTLKLSNVYKDPSFVREVIGYEIAAKYGPASKSNYINVYVNGELIGLYTNVQSVDKAFLRDFFSDDEFILFKGNPVGGPGGGSATIKYLGADSTDYYSSYELNSDYGWQEMVELCYTLNNDTSNIEDILDVDRALWLLAFHNTLVSNDSPIMAPHNFYLYMDKNDQFNYLYWDLNMTFGTFGGGPNSPSMSLSDLQEFDPLNNINNSNYPIVSELLSVDEYQKLYIAHMKTILEENFANGWYETRALELQEIIDTSVQADQKKFYSYDNFIDNIDNSISSGGSSLIVGITELMEERINFLNSHYLFDVIEPTIADISTSPETIEANSTFSLSVITQNTDNLKIGIRDNRDDKFEKFEMFDDGNHDDQMANDGIFGITLNAEYGDIQYYIYAENEDSITLSPARAEYEFHEINVITETGEIVINEINYHSSEEMDSEDWIELYNPSSEGLDISGWSFKDEDDDHNFTIPVTTILAAEEYLVLCHDSALFSAIHPSVTNFIGDFDFGLSGGGEPIRLFDAEGTLIDSVDYDDEGDWPTSPDGEGNTLELIDFSYDNTLPESWQASVVYGTPGEINSTGLAVDNNPEISENINLSNYPNPFNPTTTISFNIPTKHDTKLIIYNTKGQKVKTLVNDQLECGSYSYTWNGTDSSNNHVSSGIYFYQLNSGKVVQNKKMLLLK